MILQNQKRWVICTPSKTGSTALEYTLINKLGVARLHSEPSPYPHNKKYQHGALYTGKGERLLVVRHPLERWSSIYWFAKKRETMWLHKYTEDINMFAKHWLLSREENKYKIFNMSLIDYKKIFHPDKIFKMEELERIIAYIGYAPLLLSHSNTNELNAGGWNETKHLLSLQSRERLIALYEPDMRAFKYEL